MFEFYFNKILIVFFFYHKFNLVRISVLALNDFSSLPITVAEICKKILIVILIVIYNHCKLILWNMLNIFPCYYIIKMDVVKWFGRIHHSSYRINVKFYTIIA
jgi:hypothetical protein